MSHCLVYIHLNMSQWNSAHCKEPVQRNVVVPQTPLSAEVEFYSQVRFMMLYVLWEIGAGV